MHDREEFEDTKVVIRRYKMEMHLSLDNIYIIYTDRKVMIISLNVTCSRHDMTEKMALDNNHSFTHSSKHEINKHVRRSQCLFV